MRTQTLSDRQQRAAKRRRIQATKRTLDIYGNMVLVTGLCLVMAGMYVWIIGAGLDALAMVQ